MNRAPPSSGEGAHAGGSGRCLITGASGFIGARLTERLAAEGHRVRCLVRPTSDTSQLEGLGVELVVGDITQPRSLARAMAGCRYVCHCAALVSDWATAPEITAINVAGTRDVLEAAVDAGIERFVHFSTTDVYGYPGAAAIEETYVASRAPNWYAKTKRAAEVEVRRVERTHALDAVILRPATVYGPGSVDVVGEIADALGNGSMLLINGGRAVAGLCYVENLIDAAIVVLSHPAARGEAFNVSDGIDVTWKRFTDDLAAGLGCSPARWTLPYGVALSIAFSLESGYRLLRRATGVTTRPLLSRQAVHVMGTDQAFSNHKARTLLGWAPRVDYATGLQRTIDWLQARDGASTSSQ